MKKILFLFALLGMLAPASAWEIKSIPMINATSITISNLDFCVTNLLKHNAISTNIVGLIYTNRSGTQVTVTSGNTANLLATVAMPALPDSGFYSLTNSLGSTPHPSRSFASIFVRVVPTAASLDTAVIFEFQPVYDGERSTTVATDIFTVSVTPSATANVPVTACVVVPTWNWPLAKALRLNNISQIGEGSGGRIVVTDCDVQMLVP